MAAQAEQVYAQGKCIGVLSQLPNGGRVFTKVVDSRKHLMKKYTAWAIDFEVVESLKGKCDLVVIEDEYTGVRFRVHFVKFVMFGINEDFGHGLQVFLPISHFDFDRFKWVSFYPTRRKA